MESEMSKPGGENQEMRIHLIPLCPITARKTDAKLARCSHSARAPVSRTTGIARRGGRGNECVAHDGRGSTGMRSGRDDNQPVAAEASEDRCQAQWE
ncbi:hypothetical protein RRG08_037450 [Elysia crispata]|uniref:Uncharacterized protein n=1 Tax=Elysia crispata TaxID=231223 RepID=A0AAE0Y4G9_9GAST|nr:hypothetical protein RRG08_037450 [Elysia crispata]